MRVVKRRAEALLVAPVFVVAGATGIGLGLADGPEETAPLLFLAAFAAVFAAFSFLAWREVRRAQTLAADDAVLEAPGRVLLFNVPFAVVVVVMCAATGNGNLGAIILGGGIGEAIMYLRITRFERRTGYTVLRVKGGNRKRRIVLARHPLKDTAPGQRNPPHAQSEAPRRAP
jgi:hypothetical protein